MQGFAEEPGGDGGADGGAPVKVGIEAKPWYVNKTFREIRRGRGREGALQASCCTLPAVFLRIFLSAPLAGTIATIKTIVACRLSPEDSDARATTVMTVMCIKANFGAFYIPCVVYRIH